MNALPYSFFVWFSFVLENVFLFKHNGITILYIYIVEVIDELHMNLTLIELESNLEASQGGNYSVVYDYK